MLILEFHVRISDNGVQGGLMALYGNIYKAVEVNSINKNVTIMIDAIPLLEVAANGSTKYFIILCITVIHANKPIRHQLCMLQSWRGMEKC
uniref:Elongator complex protein 6 n=1 Tax=Tanacetum cinerariifolium TaxID=118510 RepID=A0A699IFJ5_TANCI|nr:elongator complex protein 6 [Tanacetum cinerariifolium]